jgi:hypothetical protein
MRLSKSAQCLCRIRRQDHRLAGGRAYERHDGLGGGDATIAHEQSLIQGRRASTDTFYARADLDCAGPMHLSPKLQHDLRDHKLAIAWDWNSLRIAQQLHSRVLAAGGEDGIGDVAIAIGVGETQLLDGPHRKIGERRGKQAGCTASIQQYSFAPHRRCSLTLVTSDGALPIIALKLPLA